MRFSLSADRHAARVRHGSLYLVPYYRLTAEEITWRSGDSEQQRRRNVEEVAAFLGVATTAGRGPADLADGLDEGGPTFASRVIERNFVARDTGVVPHSLGVRPTALQLRLFDRGEAREGTVLVPADLTPREAQERALGIAGDDTGIRERLRVVLQIVYFPFWMMPIADRGVERVAVIDAVTGTIVRDDVEPAEVAKLSDGRPRRVRTLGFRPLACPNCGWDLPFRPDDLLFQCSSCERGWLARGDRLEPVVFSVAASAVEAACHLPVWKLGADEDGAAVFAPAFRCRRLKALFDLGARLTRQAAPIARTDEIPKGLAGCALDQEDARALARFIAAGISQEAARGAVRPELPTTVDAVAAELVWLPFSSDGYALRESTTGAPIPRRLLDL